MGAIISYIQNTNKIQELLYKNIYEKCYNCKKQIILNSNNVYYYRILGLGKHDKKVVCQNCLKQKFLL